VTFRRRSLAVLALLLVPTLLQADAYTRRDVPQPASAGGETLGLNALEPPPTEVAAGDIAPDFSYQSVSGRWLHLHDLIAHGNVLLVFSPADEPLPALERDREALLRLGVIPVAVVQRKAGSAWSYARRQGLQYTVVPDPSCVIAAQFNVLGSSTHAMIPAWFVLDRTGRVRGLGRDGLPATGYPTLAAAALSIPAPGVTVQTAHPGR